MGFMGDCISEGWQSQGSWKSERGESERPSYKGQARNDGEEHTLTLLFATYYTLFPAICAKKAGNQKPKNTELHIFIILLEAECSLMHFSSFVSFKTTHAFLLSHLFFSFLPFSFFSNSLSHTHTHRHRHTNFFGWLQVWS